MSFFSRTIFLLILISCSSQILGFGKVLAYDSDVIKVMKKDLKITHDILSSYGGIRSKLTVKDGVIKGISKAMKTSYSHKLDKLANNLLSNGYCCSNCVCNGTATPKLSTQPGPEISKTIFSALNLKLSQKNETTETFVKFHKLLNSVVALGTSDDYVCSGLALSDVIVTAAHCMCEGGEFRRLTMAKWGNSINDDEFEPVSLSGTDQVIYSNPKIPDRHFCSVENLDEGDIALILLNKLPIFSYGPSSLPYLVRNYYNPHLTEKEHVSEEMDFFVVGFGGKSASQLIENKLFGRVFIDDIDFNSNGVHEYHASNEKDGVDTCEGDSGGPLIMIHNSRVIPIGFTSRSQSGGRRCGDGGIYVGTRLLPRIAEQNFYR